MEQIHLIFISRTAPKLKKITVVESSMAAVEEPFGGRLRSRTGNSAMKKFRHGMKNTRQDLPLSKNPEARAGTRAGSSNEEELCGEAFRAMRLYAGTGGAAGVSPWRSMISIILARSGGPPAAAFIASAHSRKNCGPIAAGVTMHNTFAS